MMKEKAIRDQIAEKFTLEMKTMEMNCARKIKEMENEHLSAITKLKELLERKAQEVETLKEFVLGERAKVTQILEAKENEISVLIKEHNELQSECQKTRDTISEWRHKAERYKEKMTRVVSLEDSLKKERESMKNKVAELQAKQAHLEQKFEKLQAEHSTIQDKYKNAKKTIYTYKVMCDFFSIIFLNITLRVYYCREIIPLWEIRLVDHSKTENSKTEYPH